jgi:hypothetical protein
MLDWLGNIFWQVKLQRTEECWCVTTDYVSYTGLSIQVFWVVGQVAVLLIAVIIKELNILSWMIKEF